MTTVTAFMPEGRQRYYNNDGTPAAGGKLYTYAAGTTNPKATYSDADGTVAQTRTRCRWTPRARPSSTGAAPTKSTSSKRTASK
jgi:hypothetical protein